jgi:AcrR family transcriptional regulator
MISQERQVSGPVMTDHRSRVGAERRSRMRACLVECALLVFAEHGIDSNIIDKVIKAAGVSRGTFYNHFRTDGDLFVAVATEVSNEIMRVVNPVVEPEPDLAARVSLGIRYVFQLIENYPLLAEFLNQGGQSALRHGKLVNEIVPRDLRLGMASGAFSITDLQLGLDLILGPVLLGFHTVLSDQVGKNYARDLAASILMSLGVAGPEARHYCERPLLTLRMPPDSLFGRAELRRPPA